MSHEDLLPYVTSLLEIGFENEPKVEYKRNSWYDDRINNIYNKPITIYINITTTIQEFLLLCEKLENLKTQMVGNMILFNIFLRFNELPDYIVFESGYIVVVGYCRFYRLPCRISTMPIINEYRNNNVIGPNFLNKGWIKKFMEVIRCLQECGVMNINVDYDEKDNIYDPFENSILPNGINFDDVKNAVKIEQYEKIYGNDSSLPFDIRNKIYSMVTPVCKEFGNKYINDVESYDYCKLQYECVNT